MTARQPRRARRRSANVTTLPRPESSESESPGVRSPARRVTARARQHHVTNDYSYVHRDLITVAGVGVVVVAFIVGMSFLL
jgi:hypothetical protein